MLNVIYEDNHILVVIKQQNIPTQKDESCDKCMVDMVEEYLKEKYNKPGNAYVGLVHRLDRPTGGVMVFAKTSKAATRLSEQIKDGTFKKKYFAVVNGKLKNSKDHLINYLKKNTRDNIVEIVPESVFGAKKAELEYSVLDCKNNLSLLNVDLFTGRSHQIRVQLKNIGNSIVGDAKYGNKQNAIKCNLALWAYQINFIHPTTKTSMVFKVAPNCDIFPWNEFLMDKFI